MTPTIPDLAAEADAMKAAFDVLGPGTHVAKTHDIGVWAIEYALNGWPVFPLRLPSLPCRVGRTGGCEKVCQCPKTPGTKNGFKDATTDTEQIVAWWSDRQHRGAGIGIWLPEAVVVLDVDEHGKESGTATMQALTAKHGRLPETMTTRTGTGWHRYFQHPGGRLTTKELPGVDLKDHGGYVIAPPTIHPNGRTYQRVGRQDIIAEMPGWLVEILRPNRTVTAATTSPPRVGRVASDLRAWSPSTSIADTYSAGTSWAEVLEPHGWTLVGGTGDDDGSRWRHPTATSAWSATIRHGCLFNYSPNAGLPVVGDGGTNGLTRFRAYAHLDHGGDLSAAAKALKGAAA